MTTNTAFSISLYKNVLLWKNAYVALGTCSQGTLDNIKYLLTTMEELVVIQKSSTFIFLQLSFKSFFYQQAATMGVSPLY